MNYVHALMLTLCTLTLVSCKKNATPVVTQPAPQTEERVSGPLNAVGIVWEEDIDTK